MKISFAVLALSLVLATSAAAETACFDWQCGIETCSFDTSCSSHGPGGFYSYRFSFGDGTSATSYNGFAQHTYERTAGPFFTVKMTILKFGAGGASTECEIRLAPPINPPIETGRCETSPKNASSSSPKESISGGERE